MDTKLFMAPVLAVTLAFLLAGAIIVIIPQDPINSFSLTSEDTKSPSSTPTPMPTSAPQAASVADLHSLPLFVTFVVAAVIVGIAAVLLFFREKPLNKD
ncbi:MAG: hypothetical protein M1540_08735 [Candidatus Bathyarchaeota archaeon]|nr:hypothetical protein [Candidatus Bathyarchaeota archaeon]